MGPGGVTAGAAADRPLLGRGRELASLWEAFEEARRGRARLMLLRGEAGIGKTSLAEEIAERAAGAGAAVFWGRCWEGEGAAAYWPWVQIIRTCLRRDAGATLGAHPGIASDLAQIVPELAGAEGGRNAPPVAMEQARFRLFDSVAGLFRAAAASGPMVLILDDLHWADAESLLLLRFVARELHRTPVLIVGTLREGEADRLSLALAEVAREARTLELGGLLPEDVRGFFARHTAATPDDELVFEVHRITEGNPFFVEEIVELLRVEQRLGAAGTSLRVPDTVRELIRRRLERLPGETRELLATAAVLGRECDVAVLERTAGLASGDAAEPLAAAAAAGIALPAAGGGRIRFSHALLVETLYDDLPFSRQVELHRRAAAALIAHSGGDVEPYLERIAHHFLHAAPGGDLEAATAWATRAGEQALARLAYEAAARLFARALSALRAAALAGREGVGRERCELLIRLGGARARAGDAEAAEEAFLDAASNAVLLADGTLLARAVLGLGGVRFERGRADTELVERLEESLRLLGPEPSGTRARVMARLAQCFYLTGLDPRHVELSREAVDTARASGDGSALAAALLARHNLLWDADSAGERLGLATEAQRLAEEAGDEEQALDALGWRLFGLLELGDIAAVDAAIADYERRAEKFRLPRQRWYASVFRTMQAMLRGRWQEAEHLAAKGQELRRVSGSPASQFYAAQMFGIRREQGRLAELGPAVHAFAQQYPAIVSWTCAIAVFHLEVGEAEAARELFERMAADDFRGLVRDVNWLPSMSMLAEVAAGLGDAPRAAVLYDLLRPYDGRNVVVVGSVTCRGAVSFFLGLLAAALERWPAAAAHFEAAVLAHQRLRAWPLAAHAQHGWATALLRLGEARKAEVLRDQALATARNLGMRSLELGIEGMAVPPSPAAASMRREGDHWVAAFEGRAVRIKDSRGCAYLAHLLAHPRQEVSSLALASALPGSTAADEERARIAVRKAISVVLRALTGEHEPLRRHLEATLRTGRQCAYEPD